MKLRIAWRTDQTLERKECCSNMSQFLLGSCTSQWHKTLFPRVSVRENKEAKSDLIPDRQQSTSRIKSPELCLLSRRLSSICKSNLSHLLYILYILLSNLAQGKSGKAAYIPSSSPSRLTYLLKLWGMRTCITKTVWHKDKGNKALWQIEIEQNRRHFCQQTLLFINDSKLEVTFV